MGPLSAEVGQQIRTKGHGVDRTWNKRAGHVLSVSKLCLSRLYRREKGILKTINKTFRVGVTLKCWHGDVKKKQNGTTADVAYSSACAFPSPSTL